ncbi:MAG: 50S ribosomal protein L34e [Thermoproteota archaeon]|jgi:large subunit ribosomal protein L34e|uniref:Large ribosomal subunit protein eL34 n=1 Tax=Candidatus Methanodesulfokora washburnensis TaxID=2478471 RepID=A0A3R9QY04_9CREN|nr:50S ribosomal protein L34e [Candidatus Methanodesulfokores washburnensis]RSN76195.1 50S ribosomal protein L34e [Candidatus Methanodesulfokores washburnensis]RZN62432.1 MAG: 50S ribosomal protein L34e [Candidatus Methanodesulfokores washburnensis]TDA38291.1 MAG: 50S ribosomal protein L34e [Candidatus Korarchaeota archaeon]
MPLVKGAEYHGKLNKRRVSVRTPGGRTVYHYRKKRYNAAKCAICKKPLNGVANGPRSFLSKLSKSEKRPNRPYGGYLCARCLRELMEKRALLMSSS